MVGRMSQCSKETLKEDRKGREKIFESEKMVTYIVMKVWQHCHLR